MKEDQQAGKDPIVDGGRRHDSPLPATFDPATVRATVKIGTIDLYHTNLLPALIRYLRRHAPGVDLQVRANDCYRLHERLRTHCFQIRKCGLIRHFFSCVLMRPRRRPAIRAACGKDMIARFPRILCIILHNRTAFFHVSSLGSLLAASRRANLC